VRERAPHLPLMPSETPIQPVVLGSDERALAASRGLAEAGFFVPAIRPPTVPAGAARLRITITAAHEAAMIEELVATLAALAEPA
ncbi:MAG: aminotransferase class I/II-fold pyridoxal phosphate-dependent enzyme, partial [Mariprofundaceae bacterium]